MIQTYRYRNVYSMQNFEPDFMYDTNIPISERLTILLHTTNIPISERL